MSPNRREFLGITGACLGFLAARNAEVYANERGGPDGSMAELTEQHLKGGFWSADSILLSAAKYLRKPEDIVTVATGFGGGIQMKDLCGYLTGGVMAIGLSVGSSRGDDKTGRERCQRLTKEYTGWWADNFPLHCKDMPQPCDFMGMGKEASRFLQNLFDRKS